MSLNNSKYCRTDLAVEIFDPDAQQLPKGVSRRIRKSSVCTITEITVHDIMAEIRLGKSKGRYITIETDSLSAHPQDLEEQSDNIAHELSSLIPDKSRILVAGLGNPHITPDALGPKTADRIIATRHLSDETNVPSIGVDIGSAAVISAGVMGQTGIESSELISAVCSKINPTCIIAVDALACTDISRLGSTIQISDSGISPGSGVQNRRKELSRENLGVQVIAVGVPTVVDMHSIVCSITGQAPDKHLPNMMVAPRDIDKLIDRASHLLAYSINKCIHPSLSGSDILSLM